VSVSFVGRSVAMSLVSLLLNLLWIVFGGLWMALGWVIAAVVMAITIVGLPWARAAFASPPTRCCRSARGSRI
jgi:Inner membrane component domain